ncbi:hypothetical protein ABC382_00890 [Lysinibacillus sp. 1P01SD]|uniref:hypothetical protein n=1 Tax=Lysinibacillus sp. 1P01SD TaxID=3132285 RepID=UPI0039A13D83
MTINLNLMNKLNKISVLNNRISDLPENLSSLSNKVTNRVIKSDNLDRESMSILKFVLKQSNESDTKKFPYWAWASVEAYDFKNLHPRLTEILLDYHAKKRNTETIPLDLVKALNANIINNGIIHDSKDVPNTLSINLWETYHGTGKTLSDNTIMIFEKQWEQIVEKYDRDLSTFKCQKEQLGELLDFAMFLTKLVEASILHGDTMKNSNNLFISHNKENSNVPSTKTLDMELIGIIKKLINENDILDKPKTDGLLHLKKIVDLLKRTKLNINQVDDITSMDKGFSFLYELYSMSKSHFITPIHNLKGYLVYGKSLNDAMLPPYINKYIQYLKDELELDLTEEELKGKLDILFDLFSDKKKFFENALLKLDKTATIILLDSLEPNKYYSNERKPVFYYIKDVVNMNTLTAKSLNELIKIKSKELYKLPIAFDITSEEYILLSGKRDFPYIDKIHEKMNNWKVTDRIDALKILPEISEDLMQAVLKVANENYFVSSVIDFVHQPNAKHYRSQFNNQMLSKGCAFIVSVLSSTYPILRQATTDWELWLLFNTLNIDSVLTIEDAKKWYMTKSTDVKALTRWLELSDTFLHDNTDRILDFLRKGLYETTLQHYENSLNTKKDNIKLLAKAEIAGKLKDIKLKKEGVEAEIQEVISDELYEKWYDDKSATIETIIDADTGKKFKFTVNETTDYGTLLKMGRIPTHSCMDWENGEFRSCLLSIFDSNKKLLVATVNGQVVARGILRLTKMADNDCKVSFDSSELKFEDVDLQSENKPVTGSSLPITTLFLERLYTTYTGKQLKEIRETMINLIAEKAKEMGVAFSTSVGYQSTDSIHFENQYKYLLISHSKNGEQYLDSLGGNASKTDGGSYKKAEIKVMLD